MTGLMSIIPDCYYGDATEQVRDAYARIRALDPEALFARPAGDRCDAEALVQEWLTTMNSLVNDGVAERAVVQAVGAAFEGTIEFLRRMFPVKKFPATLTIEWAEGPWEFLLPPTPPTDSEGLEVWGTHGELGWTSDRHMALMLDCLVNNLPGLQALLRPPVWYPWHETFIATLPCGIPTFDRQGRSERAMASLHRLSAFIENTAESVLNFSIAQPYFGANPHEWELAMLEHGLIPLGAGGDRCYVFRYNPEPVLTPSWLPLFAKGAL